MWHDITKWCESKFSNSQIIIFLAILVIGFLSVYYFSQLLMPLLIALVLAYLLDGPVNWLVSKNISRTLAVVIVLGLLIWLFVMMLLSGMPILSKQIINFLGDFPSMLNWLRDKLDMLSQRYPEIVHPQSILTVVNSIKSQVAELGEHWVSFSINSIINLVTIGIYMFLVPLMVFFLLKDKEIFLQSFAKLLPANNQPLISLFANMRIQIASYIRGKVLEILLVTIVTYIALLIFGLRYSLLLSVIAGVSVLIPYVGAVAATIPVALVGLVQYGLAPQFYYVVLVFVIIQLLDGNVIVPLLFSEAVNLHPLTIIVSVLFFGQLWDFWGVFFAIPLAAFFKTFFVILSENFKQKS